MPLPELLDELFRLYRRHFSLIVAVALIVALPGAVWQLVTGTYKLTANSYANLFTTSPGAAPSFSSQQFSDLAGVFALGALGALILLPFSVGAVYRAVTDVALGRPATIGSVLRGTLARYLHLLGLLAIFVGMVVGWVLAYALYYILLVLT